MCSKAMCGCSCRIPKQRCGSGSAKPSRVAGRPHLVTNAGEGSLTFLVLQGIGEYDYVPLV